MPRRRRIPEEHVRAIRRAIDARRSMATDRELAERYGISVGLVRAIGRRDRHADVPDDTPPKKGG